MARQRADGRWEERVHVGGVRRSFYGKTEREAAQARNKYLIDHDPDRTPTRAPTLEKWLTRWLLETRPPHYSYNTWRKHESAARIHLIPLLGATKLTALTRADVVRLVQGVATKRKPVTADNIRESLATALTAAREAGWLKENVALKPVPLADASDATEELVPLTVAEARKVLDAARGHRLEALFLLNVTTGMRQGEILGLVWSDIDWEGEFLTARSQLQREPTDQEMSDGRRKIGAWVRKALKGKRARRIYLPARTAEALRRRQREQRQEDSEHPWGLVFTLPDGRPLNAAHVRLMHHAVLAEAGVRPQKFHDLRHAAATILLDQGVPMHLVSAMLGHASLATTDRVYRHIADQSRRRAAEAMDAAFEEPPPDDTIRSIRAVR